MAAISRDLSWETKSIRFESYNKHSSLWKFGWRVDEWELSVHQACFTQLLLSVISIKWRRAEGQEGGKQRSPIITSDTWSVCQQLTLSYGVFQSLKTGTPAALMDVKQGGKIQDFLGWKVMYFRFHIFTHPFRQMPEISIRKAFPFPFPCL